ncbi:hypothetical protein OSTOST_19272, partial [Ostertagia ostertagi]
MCRCDSKGVRGYAPAYAYGGWTTKSFKSIQLGTSWDDVSDVSEIDKQFFFANIIEQFAGIASGHGIPDMCRIMRERGQAIQNIAKFNEYMTRFYQGGEFNYTFNSYKDYIKALQQSLFTGE